METGAALHCAALGALHAARPLYRAASEALGFDGMAFEVFCRLFYKPFMPVAQ
jgi:cytochrome c oxidase assembly protein Cox11